jgi:predicted nucleotidyltransferase
MGSYDGVFRALSAASVRYVVVGGTAVVLQGHARLTVDLDLVVDLAPEQVSAALEALTGIGLRPRLPVDPQAFADPATRRSWVEQRNLLVFSLFHPEQPRCEVDLFATEPLPFDELYTDASTFRIAGVDVRVASRAHLIAMKRQAGRPRDLDDIAVLEALDEQ